MLHALRHGRAGRLALFLAVLLLALVFYPLPAFADGGDPANSTGDIVSTTAMWGVIVGIFTPPLVAVIQQPKWSSAARSTVTVLISVGLAAATCAIDGDLGHGQTLLVTVGTVLISAQTTYRELWSKIGVTQKIENATAIGTEGAPGDSQADPPPEAVVTRQTRSRRGG